MTTSHHYPIAPQRRRCGMPKLGIALAVPAAALALVDLVHLTAHLAAPAPTSGTRVRRALLVLGHPSRANTTPHPSQRWRARIAARTARPGDHVIFSGAPGPSGRSEAAVMAVLARDEGLRGDMVLEESAHNTWQNVAQTLTWLERADEIIVVSDPLHAWRGRRFLRRQRPDLAGRLRRANDFCLLEHPWLKAFSIGYEIVGHYREWRHPRLPDAAPSHLDRTDRGEEA